MHRTWLVNRTNKDFLNCLARQASISPLLAQVLVNRGLKDAGSIREFLNPLMESTHDPFLLPDMRKGVERVRAAMNRGETVLVHGDYDADGITASALLLSSLRSLGLKALYHIPNRMTEGYGFSREGIRRARALGVRLIITADCGISSRNEVAEAGAQGMDVIVTDHHEPPEQLPDAVAVIDPHRKDSCYPFRGLAGVGVAFKFAQALAADLGRSGPGLEDLLDLVALGTIADSAPLLGENRILVTHGLRMINDSMCRTGIRVLKDIAGANGNSRGSSLSYSLIPRINAAGRIDDASRAVELFLTRDEGTAREIAALLDEQNRKRQKIEAEVLKSALDMIGSSDPGSVIILSSQDWHPGVIGIVASRLVEIFYRPVFLFSVRDSVAKGSARGIPPIHLYEVIDECAPVLRGYGGHRQAAGLSLDAGMLSEFRDRMTRIVEHRLGPEKIVPILEIDAAVKLSDLNFNLVRELALLEPFGECNREPVFGAKGAEVVSHRIVGNNHLKIQLRQCNVRVDTIGFTMGDQANIAAPTATLDIAFTPCINEWNGTRSLQLNLRGIRPGSTAQVV
ncbi:MAG: single-stranded-DNA-specific exonuclease RecJ [Nitrospiraceae bacterium]|nr:MAG: single-stranded-DNA-specific exonuclease RecJ [Nitrospiraceae bacterium]